MWLAFVGDHISLENTEVGPHRLCVRDSNCAIGAHLCNICPLWNCGMGWAIWPIWGVVGLYRFWPRTCLNLPEICLVKVCGRPCCELQETHAKPSRSEALSYGRANIKIQLASTRHLGLVAPSAGCSRLNATLSLQYPLDRDRRRDRTPSAIGSAVGRPHLALSCIHAQGRSLDHLFLTA